MTKALRHLNTREHVRGIGISINEIDYLKKITLKDAIKIAESYLPKHPPIVEKYLETYPYKTLHFSKEFEKLYLIYKDNKNNEIVYTAKYKSKENQPDIFGKEGYTPYYEAIRIRLNLSGIIDISIGGMQYEPARLQKNKNLDISIITDQTKLHTFLNTKN